MLALPKTIDVDALSQRLDRVFSGQETVKIDDAKTVAKLSPDELWQRFGVIGLDRETKDLVGSAVADAVAVAVVIYGASIVVSNSNTALAVSGSPSFIASIEQLQTLRDLARLRKGDLKFSVSGPNGVAVDGLSADVIGALLARLN
jgi:hypothetical protein